MLIKIDALKNFTNHTGKIPILKSPLNKTASPQVHSLKRDYNTNSPAHSPPPFLPCHETSKNIPLYRTLLIMAVSGEKQNMTLV